MTILIDGSGFAKAAFVPGQNALCHRFLSRVFRLNLDGRGRPITVAWDARDNVSGRRARFPAYKANRAHGGFGGEEYAEQAFELRGLLQHLGVHQAWSGGWEADDVLATMARSASGEVLLLTRDRDLFQLVDERVTVLAKIGSDELRLTPDAVEKYLDMSAGVYRDWKALAGDAGDGVPGMEGIGEKTASALLSWRPTLVEDLLNSPAAMTQGNLQMLEARTRTALIRLLEPSNLERLELMRWLVSLHDVPLTVCRGRLDLRAAERDFAVAGLRQLGARLREWKKR